MSPLSRRLTGLLLVPIGVGLMPLTLFAGASTVRGCEGFDPDFLGVEFNRAEITGIDLQAMTDVTGTLAFCFYLLVRFVW